MTMPPRRRADVQTHSAGRLHQTPISFAIEGEAGEHTISSVAASWIEDDGGGQVLRCFRVVTEGSMEFVLVYRESDDTWEIT